jgi:hypothetical protein
MQEKFNKLTGHLVYPPIIYEYSFATLIDFYQTINPAKVTCINLLIDAINFMKTKSISPDYVVYTGNAVSLNNEKQENILYTLIFLDGNPINGNILNKYCYKGGEITKRYKNSIIPLGMAAVKDKAAIDSHKQITNLVKFKNGDNPFCQRGLLLTSIGE